MARSAHREGFASANHRVWRGMPGLGGAAGGSAAPQCTVAGVAPPGERNAPAGPPQLAAAPAELGAPALPNPMHTCAARLPLMRGVYVSN